jgi:hypothetical protein
VTDAAMEEISMGDRRRSREGLMDKIMGKNRGK